MLLKDRRFFLRCKVQFWDLNSTSTRTCCAGRHGKEPNRSGDTLLFADHSKTTRYTQWYYQIQGSHTIHAWYLYLNIPWKSTIHVGKYTSPMDHPILCTWFIARKTRTQQAWCNFTPGFQFPEIRGVGVLVAIVCTHIYKVSRFKIQ